MIPKECKRLIEVDFPIAAVSAHSAREKSIRHGHPSTLHLWWARRPLAACRSVLLGLLLPDPCDKYCPADFKKKARELLEKRYNESTKTDELLRELLLKFIGEFSNWDHAANSMYLEIGRGLVKAAHPDETPVVVDPFAGGGSIPLEALRLGCEAFASDLNPVACLILKTLLEDIPRYGNADFKLKDDDGKEKIVHGLADALRHVGKQVKHSVDKELGQFYPPDPDGAIPIAYLWARTVRCEAVGCGAEIPLVHAFWLSRKSGRKRALRYTVERPKKGEPSVQFEIFTPKSDSALPDGTVHRADATCLCCKIVLPAERVRSQLTAQHGGADVIFDKRGRRTGGATLLAVATIHRDQDSREYRLPVNADYRCVWSALNALGKRAKQPLSTGVSVMPDEPLPWKHGHRAVASPRVYGMTTWGDLFTARQKLALAVLSEKIRDLEDTPETKVLKEILALAVSRFCDISNAFCRWENTKTQVRSLFGRHALPMLWDFAEASFVAEQAGDYSVTLGTMIRVIEKLVRTHPETFLSVTIAQTR